MTQLPSRRHHYLPLGIGLLIGGGLSALAAFTLWHWELEEAQHRFEEYRDHLTQHLQAHLDEYVQVTKALGIFYNASDAVTRKDFSTFARPWLQDYPGIVGVAWTPRISPGDRFTYEQQMQGEGLESFRIWNRDNQPLSPQADSFPITYGEPPQVYQSIMGFNLGSMEVLHNAVNQARDSGEITASHSLGLLSGEEGFILINPVYRLGTIPQTPEERRQDFMGVVYTVYELPNLIQQTLEHLPYHHLDFFLFDGSTPENKRLELSFDGQTRTVETFNASQSSFALPSLCQTLFNCQQSLTIADHQWSLVVIPNFNPLILGIKPGIIFLLGLILTALLELYLWRVLTEKSYIEQLVDKRTVELRQLTDTLEKRVEERTAELQAAIQGKNELLGQIGHEFRTPLTIILGFIELFDRDRNLSSQQQENLGIMRRSGEYLLTLFNDILEISKLETQGDFSQPTSFNLHSLVETVIEIVQLKAQAKNLSLTTYIAPEVPQHIKADESKLRQILINLLDNAIKFTEEGTVTLRLESDNQSWLLDDPSTSELSQTGRLLWFEVEDTGVGIPLDFQKQVFEPFVRGVTGQGVGLGLAITQKLVHLMGGNIHLNSPVEADTGTLIRFYLPLVLPNAQELPQTQPVHKILRLAPYQGEYRILVVDDYLENRQLLTRLLRPLGFEIQGASNSQEALDLWFNWRPHLILLDIQFPLEEDKRTMQQLSQLTHSHRTVIIGLTARREPCDPTRPLTLVCDDVLYKPFEIELLLDKIAIHLGVCYEYEARDLDLSGSSPDGLGMGLQPSSLQGMPLEWIEGVYQAASEGNSQELYRLIEQIPSHRYSLTVSLTELVNHFNFRQIRKLIQMSDLHSEMGKIQTIGEI